MVVCGRVVGGSRESEAAYTWKGEGVIRVVRDLRE